MEEFNIVILKIIMNLTQNTPLAERMRPKSLGDYVHQTHLVGKNAPIRNMIEQETLSSMILWGPPGTGKTTLAELIASETQREFFPLSAINSGVKEVREVIAKAKDKSLFSEDTPIVFVDEIHRFNKNQQDSLLQAVEKGWITLIGATTENPSFEVVSALLSRTQVYVLNSFDADELRNLLQKALENDAILQQYPLEIEEDEALIRYSGGDARKLYNGLEIVFNYLKSIEKTKINNKTTTQALQTSFTRYDKNGENHYDIISAFIKSIRGSDADAALYWLARMIDGGEDVKFIARRLLISAAEDIGLANPTALIMAQNTFQAVSVIGYPEARIILSECTVYLALSPKSNSVYRAIDEALAKVQETGNLPVPLHLRNAPTKLMKDLEYGKEYLYPHDYPNNFIPQNYLPDELSDTQFFNPTPDTKEENYKDKLKIVRENRKTKNNS